MVYIPGPGSKNTPDSIKKVINENKHDTEKDISYKKKDEKIKQKQESRKTKKESIKKTEKSRYPFFFYLLMTISIFFSIAAFFKMYDAEKSMQSRMDAMSSKYNTWYQEIKQKSDETYELIKPNGWLNEAVLSASLIEDYIIGVDDIINIAQEKDFKDVAYCQIFISGNSPVWISVEGNSKTLFGKNISPGLSNEQFYYYKQPKVIVENKTLVIPKNFKITSGNYENTYILFFNFGTTKLVRMNDRSISNVISAFNIWVP